MTNKVRFPSGFNTARPTSTPSEKTEMISVLCDIICTVVDDVMALRIPVMTILDWSVSSNSLLVEKEKFKMFCWLARGLRCSTNARGNPAINSGAALNCALSIFTYGNRV